MSMQVCEGTITGTNIHKHSQTLILIIMFHRTENRPAGKVDLVGWQLEISKSRENLLILKKGAPPKSEKLAVEQSNFKMA